MSSVISRRELLKRAGLAGAAAVVPIGGRHVPERSLVTLRKRRRRASRSNI